MPHPGLETLPETVLDSVSIEWRFSAVVICVHTGARPPVCASPGLTPFLTTHPRPQFYHLETVYNALLPEVIEKMVTTQETLGTLLRVQEMCGTCQVTAVIVCGR